MRKCITILLACFCILFGASVVHASNIAYSPIDFSSYHNYDLSTYHLNPPEGTVSLGSIPFEIPIGMDCWNGATAAGDGSGTVTMDINVNLFAASQVHTLINTIWGQPGPDSYGSIEFWGSDTAYYKLDLVGNEHIRDFANNDWTNDIDDPGTVQVFTTTHPDYGWPTRMDLQGIALPTDFYYETLTLIRVTDSGNQNVQRLLVSGITVGTIVPEPGTLVLLFGLGLSLLLWRARR